MKLKHNKKRNTGFLFESLIKEATKTIISKNNDKKEKIISIIREHFKKGTILAKELELYHALVETSQDTEHTQEGAEKVLQEAKRQYDKLDKDQIFEEQSYLINKINKIISKEVFGNFVPNYKSLATVYQIFNQDMPIKKRIMLESELVNTMAKQPEGAVDKVPADSLVLNSFISKFNEKYSQSLFEEQKTLLGNFVSSFMDSGIELKIYLNEEIGRLREKIEEAKKISEIETSPEMLNKTEMVLQLIETFKNEEINEKAIEKILKIQNLVRELETNGD